MPVDLGTAASLGTKILGWISLETLKRACRLAGGLLRARKQRKLQDAYLQGLARRWPQDPIGEVIRFARMAVQVTMPSALPSASTSLDSGSPIQPELLDHVLARQSKLVLVGEPGAGKTTTLRLIAQGIAAQGHSKPIVFAAPVDIIVYVELKEFAGGREIVPLVVDAVVRTLSVSGVEMSRARVEETAAEWLGKQGKQGARLLLLLDGINEVPQVHRDDVQVVVKTLLHSGHRLVVSCRDRDYDHSMYGHARCFKLQPLSEVDVRTYLEKVLGPRSADVYERQIQPDERMRTLVANPMMLRLLGAVVRARPESFLPDNRGQLIRDFVASMPALRRTEGVASRVPPDIVSTAMECLAFGMQDRGTWVARMGEVRGWGIPTATKTLEEVLEQAKDWRFMSSDGQFQDEVSFIHPLFQEYFAAGSLNSKLRAGGSVGSVVLDLPWRKGWEEVMEMLGAICDSPEEFIKELAEHVAANGQLRAARLVKNCWSKSGARDSTSARKAVVELLGAALVCEDPDARLGAAWMLRDELPDRVAVPALISALNDPEITVQMLAADALGAIRDPRAVEPLIKIVQEGRDWVRGWAVMSLGAIGDRRAVPVLRRVLREDPDSMKRQYAAFALGWIRDPAAVDDLIATVEDDASDIARGPAANALGMIGDPRAIPPLLRALRYRYSHVRGDAAYSLGEIGERGVFT